MRNSGDTMKAAVYYGPKDIRVEEVSKPQLDAADVLIKVKAVLICGSDLAGYARGKFIPPGQIMGHEFSGEIVEVGKDVKDLSPGERVSAIGFLICGECFWCKRKQYHLCPFLFTENPAYGKPGAFAEFVKIPRAVVNRNVFELPDDVSFEEGAALEPLSVACFAVSKARPEPGNSILVLGAGMIGLSIAAVLKATGEYRVMVSDISPKRLGAAQRIGVDAVMNPDREDIFQRVKAQVGEGKYHFGVGSMTDIIMECAGTPQTINQALQLVRSGGKVLLVGTYKNEVPVNPNLLIHKDIALIGCLGGLMKQALSLVAQHKVALKDFFTHTFSLDQIREAFETQADAGKSIKVVIKP
jgi:2-desacetyl-2-hydroxyethyl bacteriochlorophyllide A dehydrogenase